MRNSIMGAGCVALIAAGLAAPVAWAQDPSIARGLAATCTACHGTDGRSVGGVPPSLAGRGKGELVQMMKDFKTGARPATVMHQHAKGYNDTQLELIADYFSKVKPGPAAAAPAAR